jgi:hypothetical protein
MVRRLYIPEEVKAAIQAHISESIARAIDGYDSASEEEDTLTGYLFGVLTISSKQYIPRIRIS